MNVPRDSLSTVSVSSDMADSVLWCETRPIDEIQKTSVVQSSLLNRFHTWRTSAVLSTGHDDGNLANLQNMPKRHNVSGVSCADVGYHYNRYQLSLSFITLAALLRNSRQLCHRIGLCRVQNGVVSLRQFVCKKCENLILPFLNNTKSFIVHKNVTVLGFCKGREFADFLMF